MSYRPNDPLVGQNLFLGKLYKVKTRIGGGGFGTVYEIENNNKETFAVKKIDFSDENNESYDNGIPCLVEAAIMATYKHPNINSALDIIVRDDVLYIVQEKADDNLYYWIKNNDVNRGDILRIFKSILEGLNFLGDIVHGDIKPENILMVNDVPKIADFNLSYHKNWDVKINIGTSTYKPLEVWIEDWNHLIDIWALGCTIYYCVFGSTLFRRQKSENRNEKAKAYINALYEWEDLWCEKKNEKAPKREYYDVEYKSPRVDDDLFTSSDPLYEVLIKMLSPTAENRYSVVELLSLPIFTASTQSNECGKINRLVALNLPTNNNIKLVNKPKDVIIDDPQDKQVISTHTDYVNVANIANKIYHRYKEYITGDPKMVKLTIAWIARKIVREHDNNEDRPSFITDTILHEVYRLERDICNKLNFRLV